MIVLHRYVPVAKAAIRNEAWRIKGAGLKIILLVCIVLLSVEYLRVREGYYSTRTKLL